MKLYIILHIINEANGGEDIDINDHSSFEVTLETQIPVAQPGNNDSTYETIGSFRQRIHSKEAKDAIIDSTSSSRGTGYCCGHSPVIT